MLEADADPAAWRLRLSGLAEGDRALTLAEVRALPAVDLVTELRCIEGWSMVVHWTGARFADLLVAFPPAGRDGAAAHPALAPERLPRYAALATPGGGYYVGLEMATLLHPQTLLAWAINGEPLTWQHGAPLRLVVPIAYGIKSIKRVGSIRFGDERPRDYWAERGYDWYSTH